MRISDWSSDVCSSDLDLRGVADRRRGFDDVDVDHGGMLADRQQRRLAGLGRQRFEIAVDVLEEGIALGDAAGQLEQAARRIVPAALRSEEHTSELQSLMRISYAVFCLKKKNKENTLQASTN